MSKRKPLHPILRLMRDLQVIEFDRDVKKVRRHVKPLLDALDRYHAHECNEGCNCPDAILLARWMAKP